jgi:hypothetical protein
MGKTWFDDGENEEVVVTEPDRGKPIQEWKPL